MCRHDASAGSVGIDVRLLSVLGADPLLLLLLWRQLGLGLAPTAPPGWPGRLA